MVCWIEPDIDIVRKVSSGEIVGQLMFQQVQGHAFYKRFITLWLLALKTLNCNDRHS